MFDVFYSNIFEVVLYKNSISKVNSFGSFLYSYDLKCIYANQLAPVRSYDLSSYASFWEVKASPLHKRSNAIESNNTPSTFGSVTGVCHVSEREANIERFTFKGYEIVVPYDKLFDANYYSEILFLHSDRGLDSPTHYQAYRLEDQQLLWEVEYADVTNRSGQHPLTYLEFNNSIILNLGGYKELNEEGTLNIYKGKIACHDYATGDVLWLKNFENEVSTILENHNSQYGHHLLVAMQDKILVLNAETGDLLSVISTELKLPIPESQRKQYLYNYVDSSYLALYQHYGYFLYVSALDRCILVYDPKTLECVQCIEWDSSYGFEPKFGFTETNRKLYQLLQASPLDGSRKSDFLLMSLTPFADEDIKAGREPKTLMERKPPVTREKVKDPDYQPIKELKRATKNPYKFQITVEGENPDHLIRFSDVEVTLCVNLYGTVRWPSPKKDSKFNGKIELYGTLPEGSSTEDIQRMHRLYQVLMSYWYAATREGVLGGGLAGNRDYIQLSCWVNGKPVEFSEPDLSLD